jgi:ATP-binding cassette subfamily B protein
MVIAALIGLLAQTILELYLPNYMSDIVNVGITHSGLDDAVPVVMSEDAYQLVYNFTDTDGKERLENSYKLTQAGQAGKKLTKTYPELKDTAAYVLAETDKAKITELAADYNTAIYTLSLCLNEQNIKALKPEDIYAKAGYLTETQIADAEAKAGDVNPALQANLGVTFTEIFYKELGAAILRIQQNYILKIGGLMLLFSMLSGLATIVTGFFSARVSAGIGRALRRDVYRKVANFAHEDVNRFSTATLITRSTNDVQQIQMLAMFGLRMMCMAPLFGIGGIVMALRKSVSMSWIIVVAVVLMMSLQVIMFKLVTPRFKIMQKLTDRLNLVARESLTGLLVIRAFGNERLEEKRFDNANRDMTDNQMYVMRTMATMNPIMNFLMSGITLLIVWVGGKAVASFYMPIGDMLAFMQYVMQIIMAFMMIAQMFIMIPRAIVSISRVNEVLDTEPSIKNRENVKTLGHRAEGHIVFDHVSFKYGDAEKSVLEDICFEVKPGQTVAFIGSTGSGKSTLINLVPRFYDVTSGSITLDGVDIRDLSLNELRTNIGYIPQKGVLFSGDVATNLSLGKEDGTDEEMYKAIELAQAADFINAGSGHGLSTEIAQGGDNVSGGQKQRLSIARALIKNPPIFIFDDSFSALDFRTDAKLRKALYENTTGATILIVAQRISTIMNSDMIVVLEEGRIVGKGTHKELLASCSEYREIAESQLTKEELA